MYMGRVIDCRRQTLTSEVGLRAVRVDVTRWLGLIEAAGFQRVLAQL